MDLDIMAMPTTPKATTSSPAAYYVAKPPPPPPLGYAVHNKAAAAAYDSYDGRHGGMVATTTTTRSSSSAARHHHHHHHQQQPAGARALDGVLLLLRAAASVMAFVAVALVASCRHGDWMEFARYPEYRGLLGASALACAYSAAQATRGFRRMRASGRAGGGLADFAGDQVVAYLLITASAAALPITLRMRSAVLNVFTDAMTAAISLAFIAFAALALSAVLSAAAQPY
ncbi:CASP-like protein 4B1 [Zea mays]|uniref:CASP-like protein n=1 Tax=Zea mays TaxID=4577 RepID=A0A3L6E0S3_MAIZE|nr:CASP-like protein 4B1 [Zea mays]